MCKKTVQRVYSIYDNTNWTCPGQRSIFDFLGVQKAHSTVAQEATKAELELGHVQLVLQYISEAEDPTPGCPAAGSKVDAFSEGLPNTHELGARDVAQVGPQDGVPVVEGAAMELPHAAILCLQPLESGLALRAISHEVKLLPCALTSATSASWFCHRWMRCMQ